MKLDFLRIESFKTGILLSTFFSFLSKLLLFLQSVVIAYYFGAGTQTDLYFYCFTLLTLLSVFVNSLDASVLIPESMRLGEQVGRLASIRFLNFFIYAYFFVGTFLTLLACISPVKIFLSLSSFDPKSLVGNEWILMLSIPLFTLMVTTNLMVNILTSYRFFTMPMIIGLVNGAMVLTSMFLLHDKFDLLSAIIGQLVAYSVNIIFLIFLMKRNLNWNFAFERIKLRRGILSNMGFAMAGNITSTLSSYVPMYLLSGFSPGIITSLIFGQKTAEMPTQLITNQASSIVGIKFNELSAQENNEALNRVFLTSSQLLLFVMTPISFMMCLYGIDIISILFQRGAFDQAAVVSSVDFFRLFVLLLPMIVINTLISRLFMATQKIAQSFYYQVLFNAVLIVVIVLGVEWLGILGYPIAMIILHVTNVLGCYFLLRFWFPQIAYSKVIRRFLGILIVNLILGALTYSLKEMMGDMPKMLNLFLGGLFYVTTLVIVNRHIRLNEEIDDLIKRIVKV